jgi:cyclic pyranopterin phosphate synthase
VSELSHLDADGRARMVDVGHKAVTARAATATGRLETTAEVVALVRADGLPKADVLATARIAGIMGAKKTSELIPLCHPLPLSSVTVDFAFPEPVEGRAAIAITATAKTTGQTGVEMEALTAVAIAGLTLHDMVKAVDPAATLTDVRLEHKTGGKSGEWSRRGLASTGSASGAVEAAPERAGTVPEPVEGRAATVIVSSTSAAHGTRDDATGPVLAAWLESRGYTVTTTVTADADIRATIAAAVAARPAVILTTGGTGTTPTDRTPEATRAVIDRELPGVAEAIRARGLTVTPTAALSRGLAGLAGDTVIVNLPGSPGGVKDGIAVLDGLLDHLVAQVHGGGAHE